MRIDKSYRPELLADECYLDAKSARLIAASARAMVALPVTVARKEDSGTVSAAAMRAARARNPRDAQATVRAVRAEAPAAPRGAPRVPGFRRGGVGTVSWTINVGELKRLADALGVVSVVLTARSPRQGWLFGEHLPEYVVVQPVDPDALELGVLFGERERREVAVRVKRPRRNLDGWADEILEEAGDGNLTTRAIG